MSDIAVRAEGLCKRYRLGERLPYGRLSETLVNAAAAPLRWIRGAERANGRGEPSAAREAFLWALKDVGFEVPCGQTLGIIGHNGAGKSTLLKILTQITDATSGTVAVRGRTGSLLEVGTGFHPELTGRENIYLSGAILGMKRAEIRHLFDAIVDFAEVEAFLDTPVKRFSSGMYLRLGFAVAAHLQPEVLLVDEVLAVGDARFQEKCLGKMSDVAATGRTVLFVSHNMGAVRALCERAIWLDGGRVAYDGEAGACVSEYLARELVAVDKTSDDPAAVAAFVQPRLIGDGDVVAMDAPKRIGFDLIVRERLAGVYLTMHLETNEGDLLLHDRHFLSGAGTPDLLDAGRHRFTLSLDGPQLVPGTYRVSLYLSRTTPPQPVARCERRVGFRVEDPGTESARRGLPLRGRVIAQTVWTHEGSEPIDDAGDTA